MSFLDKFFGHKIINKNENDFKSGGEPLSFRSSNLHISKEQIRFVLFRDCNRRGRKLLFDSSAVERMPLPSKKNIDCNQKCQTESNRRSLNFIEVTSTHGYRYKKVSDDIACLGEMIFGSVAMTYKGENLCKIHKIPSPKQLMFTTIIYAPIRCHIDTINECSLENSIPSIYEVINQKETSSDSKLYRTEGGIHKCSSIYPCLKNISAPDKISQCCEVNEADSTKNYFTDGKGKLGCLKNMFLASESDETLSGSTLTVEEKSNSRKGLDEDFHVLSLSQKISGCDAGCNVGIDSDNLASSSSLVSTELENVSSVSGSLSSLRRRWAQSCSSSLDSTASKDFNNTPCKKRPKLAMALLLDINDSKNDEMEKFLFNHTILIDSIMSKLRNSVEFAYIRNQNFVDLLYTAFTEAQQSIYDFVTGGKYSVPVWISLLEDGGSREENCDEDCVDGVGDATKIGKAGKSVDVSPDAKLTFLNDFHDVLVKFDTKDTNFFISTLLTAVLTHHLSWVTMIAETDHSNRHEKMESLVKNYNPIWAQLNDLYGLLGSPLKCAKTIITGSERKRNHISAIIKVLTYFIRCFNVVENVYDVGIDEIVGEIERGKIDLDFPIEIDSEPKFDEVFDGGGKKNSGDEKKTINEIPGFESRKFVENSRTVGNLRREKSFSVSPINFYPDVGDFMKMESIGKFDSGVKSIGKKTENQFGFFREESKLPKIEISSSPDEGFDTIDFCKTDNVSAETEKKMSAGDVACGVACNVAALEPRENIVFTLGADECSAETFQKKVILTKPDLIELESEDFVVPEKGGGINLNDFGTVENRAGIKREPKGLKESRTFENLREIEDETIQAKSSDVGAKTTCCSRPNNEIRHVSMTVRELSLPRPAKSFRRKRLEVSSVFGGVNQKYNSEQIIQGVTDPESQWEQTLQKDLFLCAYNSTVEKDVSEALCIVGDVNSWQVSVRSSTASTLDRSRRYSGVRVGMSQLVADMLESFLFLRKIKLSPDFCFLHIEKKLREIYLKSKTIAEILGSTELCTIDYLTSRLDVGINDIPLLLSVATTHSPHISDKYGLSFT